MKCPLSPLAQWDLGHKPKYHFPDCLKEECAWYYEGTHCCIFRRLILDLSMVSQRLKDIAKELTLIRPNK